MIIKISRIGVIFIFLFFSGRAISSIYAVEEEGPKTFWESHGKVEDEKSAPGFSGESSSTTESGSKFQKPDQPIPLTLENLRIPTQDGSLKKTYSAREPLIIHIQDAHANYEAQKHLSSILEYLVVTHGLSLILVEGGSRNDSLSYMRTYAPLEKRKEVAEEFLKSGKISGENYLDLTTDYNFTVYGIEKPELYDENMEAFFSVEKVQPQALSAMKSFRDAVENLKQKIYPDDVKTLELRELEVKEGRIPLAQHYQSLADEAGKRKVALDDKTYPNLLKFIRASAMEKEMNFKTVETERTKFLEALTKSLPKPEMDKLLQQSLDLKKGLVTPASFYGNLRGTMKPGQNAEYPVLANYIEYLALFEAIDHASLFTEVENLSDQIKDSYFKDKGQRTLAKAAKDVGVLEDLLELKLTPDSYDYYRTHRKEFKPDEWADNLRALAGQQNPPMSLLLSPGALNAAIPAMSSFYEVARKRDEAMMENALKQIKEFNVPFAVLIAGGFHTPAFERLFKEQKASYAVVAPKVSKVTQEDTDKYHRVLKETYVPMSEKYRQKQGLPSSSLGAASVQSRKTATASLTETRPASEG